MHGAKDSGKYLVMMMLHRDKLLKAGMHGRRAERQSNPAEMQTDPDCHSCLQHFAQLRQNLQKEKKMTFVIAERRMLDSAAWSDLYVAAVRTASSVCPVIVWHPKRTKYQILSCKHDENCQHALEQTLDGNVSSWMHRPWPV